MHRSTIHKALTRLFVALPILTLAGVALSQPVKHAALAYSEANHHWGWARDQATAAEAEQAAVSSCGAGCTVRIAWHNGCGAYAEGSQNIHYGWALGNSASEAQQRALAACNGGNNRGCTVRVFACN